MIECMIYTQSIKEKVVKPSQWKDDMYISLTWDDDNDFEPDEDTEMFCDWEEDDDVHLCPRCEDHDALPTHQYCRFCEEEIFNDENA